MNASFHGFKTSKWLGAVILVIGMVGETAATENLPTNALHLSLISPGKPQLTISGSAGLRCEIQYSLYLSNPTPWVRLTSVELERASMTLIDSNAAGAGSRFYRAMFESGSEVDFASGQLMAGESYRFTILSTGITNVDTLVVNSASSGLVIQDGITPKNGISDVILQYRKLGPLSAEVKTLRPASPMDPMGRTNTYLLVFTSRSGGSFQKTSDPAMPQLGQFVRDRSLAGREMAPAQLIAGESYRFTTRSAGFTNVEALVVNSASSGLLIREGMLPESGISEVAIQYRKLGPLSAEVKAIFPFNPMDPIGRSNTYLLVFTSTNSGYIERTIDLAITQIGQFERDQSMVGQIAAPAQLTPGETYRFTSGSVPMISVETVVVNSASSGFLIREGSFPDSGINEVLLQYRQLGPRSAEVKTIWPSNLMDPMGRTNTYLLAFTSKSGGGFEKSSDPAMTQTGQFTLDQRLVGQEAAPAQLTAGEIYRFTTSSAGMTNAESLVVNSASSGLMIREGTGPESGISEVTLQYRKLGLLVAEMMAVWPTNPIYPIGRTTTYLMVFTSSGGGLFTKSGDPIISQTGSFERTRP